MGDWWSVASSIYRHHFIEVYHGKVVHLFDEAKWQRLASVRVDDEYVVTRGRQKRLHGSGGLAAAKLALSRIGDSGYNLAHNNCEHFARWCTTGEHRSAQVDSVVTGLRFGLIAGGVLAAVILTAGSVPLLGGIGIAIQFGLLATLPVVSAIGLGVLALLFCNNRADTAGQSP